MAESLGKKSTNCRVQVASGVSANQVEVVDYVTESERTFLRYMKVALSVAVIRSRPTGMTGRQYAEHLFLQSQRQQLLWRTRSEELKEEVLQLKQQLIQTQASVDGAASMCEHRQLQPDVGPTSDSQTLFLTPPCSSSECNATDIDSTRQKELFQHVTFLQSILTLKSLSSLKSVSITSTTVETLQRVLQMLQPWLCGGADYELSAGSVEYAIEAITKLLISPGLMSITAEVSDALLDMVQDLLKNVVEYNWSCEKIPDPGRQRRICQVIIALLRHAPMRAKGTALLARRLCDFSSFLRLVKTQAVQLEPHTYENIYHIMWCLERIIGEEIRSDSKVIADGVLMHVDRLLDDSLLHVSEEFPLFAQYVWHIGGLLRTLKHVI